MEILQEELINEFVIYINNMNEKKPKMFPLYFAIFGFMLIIATGTDFLLTGTNNLPLWISIIGLFFIIIAFILRKRENKI